MPCLTEEHVTSIFRREREAHIESELRQLHCILNGGLELERSAVQQQNEMRAGETSEATLLTGKSVDGFDEEPSRVENDLAQRSHSREGLEALVGSLRSQMQRVREELLNRTLLAQAEQRKNAVLLGIIREMKMRWDARERDFSKTRRDAVKKLKREQSATIRQLEATCAELGKRDETIQELKRELSGVSSSVAQAASHTPQLLPATLSVLHEEPSGHESGAREDFVSVKASEFSALRKVLEVREACAPCVTPPALSRKDRT